MSYLITGGIYLKVCTVVKNLINNRLIAVLGIATLFALSLLALSTSTAIAENSECYRVEFNQSIYYVDEDDQYVTLNLTLNRTIWGDAGEDIVIVFYNTRNGTAKSAINFLSPVNASSPDAKSVIFRNVSFRSNFSQLIQVPILNDGIYDSTDKFFFMNLTYLVPDISTYPDGSIYGGNRNVTIIINEASSKPTVQFVADSYTIDENEGTASVFVMLSGPTSEDVVVNYETSEGTALEGVNYTAKSGSVTFPAGSTSQEITVTLLSDGKDGENTFFFVNLTGASSNAEIGSSDATQVTINDDEQTFTVNLKSGWNLVSSPLVLPAMKASDLDGTGVTMVAKYNPQWSNFTIFQMGWDEPSGINDFEFSTDVGYFIAADEDTPLTFAGSDPVSRTATIPTANIWGLYGWSTLNSASAYQFSSMVTGDLMVAKFNNQWNNYTIFQESWSEETDFENFVMAPGEGYFIASNTPTTINYGGI